MNRFFTWVSAIVLISTVGLAQGPSEKPGGDTFKEFAFRGLGPDLTTGRISDIAINPRNPNVWYVAASSGNLWKTENRGNTWTPIFENYGSYFLGAVTVDPKDSNIVWLGTGENNNQRSVSYGDGVYKSTDAGKTWKRMGLENSEHIQNIVVDPHNSSVVYLTAIGPLWTSGGDRGLFKTTDGGQTWKAVLSVSADTGVTDMVMDPRKPEVIYAAAYQRRRQVGQLIGGGPESGLYKTTNGGQSWTKLTKGLPTVDIGRIGLAINWKNPNTVYALVWAQNNQGGFFRSDDAGHRGGGSAGWSSPTRVEAAERSSRPPPRADRWGQCHPRLHHPLLRVHRHRRMHPRVVRLRSPPPRRRAADAVEQPTIATEAAIPATTTRSTSTVTIQRRSGRRRPTSGGAPMAERRG